MTSTKYLAATRDDNGILLPIGGLTFNEEDRFVIDPDHDPDLSVTCDRLTDGWLVTDNLDCGSVSDVLAAAKYRLLPSPTTAAIAYRQDIKERLDKVRGIANRMQHVYDCLVDLGVDK